jgi:transposase, IS30 family
MSNQKVLKIIHKPKYKTLNSTDRIRIETLLGEGLNQSQVADRIGFDKSTISRELSRNSSSGLLVVKTSSAGSCGGYNHKSAGRRSSRRISRRKLGKSKLLLGLNPSLKDYVHEKLKLSWSPDQIAKTLKKEFTSDMLPNPNMQISHEAIYQYIYVLPKGSLKKELVEGLRRGHKYRRLSKKKQSEFDETRGKIADMLSIHERPIEVEDRIIPGHWESDLIIGKYKQSALATLVERTTRYTIIVELPNGKTALEVRTAIAQEVQNLPQLLKKTLTHDQGKEMSQHKQFTIDTDMKVYFADPASPWQRGTNENTNGLIRQFFPKGADFRLISRDRIKEVQGLLNGRPRAVLDYCTPNELFSKYVALDG